MIELSSQVPNEEEEGRSDVTGEEGDRKLNLLNANECNGDKHNNVKYCVMCLV